MKNMHACNGEVLGSPELHSHREERSKKVADDLCTKPGASLPTAGSYGS